MHKLPDLALRFRTLIFLFTALVLAGGLFDILSLPMEPVPDISPKQVLVTIVAPGLAPEEVERLVTFPIETQMTGLPGMSDLRSISRFGVSVVYVQFEDSTDINLDRTIVSERLQQARGMITAAQVSPLIGPLSTGLGEVYQFQLADPNRSLMDLRTIMEWQVAPQLKQVPGVVDLNINGGDTETFEVRLNEQALIRYGISLGEVFAAVDANNVARGGAWILHNQEQQVIVGRGLIRNLDDLGSIVLRAGPDGTPVYIRNVAELVKGARVRLGAVTRDGKGEIVNGVVLMLYGENAGVVVDRVKAQLQKIQATLPKGVEIKPFYDRTDLTVRTIDTVAHNLFEGAVLVTVVLLLMLGSWRAAVIVAAVIPLSLLIAMVGMHHFGISANLMSLGAIDFGMIVDGSVVLVENTLRHRAKAKPAEAMQKTISAAAAEVARPIVFAIAIIVIVYLPVLSLQSIEGKMFRPMAYTVILALLASLLIALTVIPALASVLLPSRVSDGDTWLMRQMRRVYVPMLAWSEAHAVLTTVIAIVIFAGSVLVARGLGGEFIPQLQEGTIVVTSQRLPSVALPTSIANVTLIEKTVRSFPEVVTVVSNTGTAAIPTDPMGVNQTDSFIILKPISQWTTVGTQDELVAAISKRLNSDVPGTMFSFSQPIQMRMDDLLEGVRTAVAISIFGPDLTKLANLGNQVARVVGGIQGAADTNPEQVGGLPFMHIDVDRAAAARFGINVSDVLNVVDAIGGHIGSNVTVGNAQFATQVRFRAGDRGGIETIRNLRVRSPSGGDIPLSELARITVESGPSEISRDKVERRTIVQTNVRGRDISSFVQAAQAAVRDQVKLPEGYRIEWAGEFQNLNQATARLSVVVPIALTLIFVMLYVMFESFKLALLIFLNLPMAATGGIYALALRGLPFSVSAGIGFIALFGIAILNGVVLVSYIVDQRKEGKNAVTAAATAAKIRLRPVLTTALVASLGFIPMAFSTTAGAEVQRPLATVVIGGLLTSTLLTLLVLPAIYPWFAGERRRRGARVRDPAPAELARTTTR
jgi:cobalt-zinc-cadmium resistance protein CzcA